MALYQLMTVRTGEKVATTSGQPNTRLKHLKRRLSKKRKGWIVEVGSGYKNVVAVRGFSKAGMRAMFEVGRVELL